MQRVKEALAAADKKTDIPISAAMGYAWSDDPDKDTEKLLQSADAKKYFSSPLDVRMMVSGGLLLTLLIRKEWKNMETSRKQETGLKEEQKWERIALGVWKVRFGTPSAYTPTAHRSNEIKTEALSVLSAAQSHNFRLAQMMLISSRQHVESW